MTSKFACFGPGFLTGFLKVGLPKYVPGCPNPEKNLPQLTKQTKLCFGTPFTTLGQEAEWALFLQPKSPHGAIHQSKWMLFFTVLY